MKINNIIAASVLLFCFFPGYAQPQMDKVLVGGTSSFHLQFNKPKIKYDQFSQTGNNTTTIQFMPQIGYMISDNLAMGMEMAYASSSAGKSNGSTSAFAFGPFAKYYFNVSSPNLFPFLYSAAGIGSEQSNADGDKQITNLTFVGFGGGMAIFLHEKVSMDFGLYYISKNSKIKEIQGFEFIQNIIQFGLGFGIFL